jgi:hypothetical protein
VTTVQIDLPDVLARQAGLFTASKMEAILRAQLRREAVQRLHELQARAPEALTPELEQEIIDAVDSVRRQH